MRQGNQNLIPVLACIALFIGADLCIASEPLRIQFSRVFGALPDGSWDGLFSSKNKIDPIAYAGKIPEQKPFYSAQYALSSTTAGKEIWYGTAASVWCYWPYISMKMPLTLTNYETPNQGCQMTPPSGQRPTAQIYFHDLSTGQTTHVGPNAILNGVRFLADSTTGIVERSSLDSMFSMPGYTYRGAGSIGDLVFFAGSNQFPVAQIRTQWLDKLTPAARAHALEKFPEDFDFSQQGQIGYNRIFVFNHAKKAYLGYADFFFDTVRRFQTITHPDGSEGLYWFGGPDQSGGQLGQSLNAMLRWVGTQEAPLAGGQFGNGFDIVSDRDFQKFGVVGDFNEFIVKGRKHFVGSSWYNPSGEPAALLVSNAIPEAGFTTREPVVFEPVMRYTDYDPDPVAARGSKFAAIAFFGRYLYFGSYHQGTSGAYDKLMHEYCQEKQIESLCRLADYDTEDTSLHHEFMMKSWRAASVFRIGIEDLLASHKQPADRVELLYGKKDLWVFEPTRSAGSRDFDGYTFTRQPNRLRQRPRYGDEGFGHPGMVYTFTLVAHDDKLFLGTWNAASGLFDMFEHRDHTFWNHKALHLFGLTLPLSPFGQTSVLENNPAHFLYQSVIDHGQSGGYTRDEARKGWLMVFENTDSPAVLVKDGFGNPCNNGVRNYAKIEGVLYLGTTSWCNLGERAGLEYYRYDGAR